MQTSTTRMETFSDGVIAIILTIMVLELKLPEVIGNKNEYDIKYQLIHLLPNFAAYVLSFIMVAILWTNHHHLINLLQKTDNFLLGQNLFFLFWMSLIPFVTSIVGTNPALPLSAALYGFIMLMTTFTLSFMRSYTMKKRLIHTDEEREIKNKIYKVTAADKVKSYMGTTIYLLSVPLAFINVWLSYICFVVPIIWFLWPSGIDEEKLAEKVIEKNN